MATVDPSEATPTTHVRVPLLSNDRVTVSLLLAAAKRNSYFSVVLPEDGVISEPLPVPGMDGEVLGWVCSFLEQRLESGPTTSGAVNRPLARLSDLRDNGFTAWASAFIDTVPLVRVFDVMRAAEFICEEELMDLASARIALRYAGMTYAERSTLFALPPDVTPEEEEKIRADNAWAAEDGVAVDAFLQVPPGVQ